MNVKITFFFQDRFHDKLKKGKIFEILNKHLSLINLKSVHLSQNLPYATTKKFEKTRRGVGKNLVKSKKLINYFVCSPITQEYQYALKSEKSAIWGIKQLNKVLII